MRPHPNNKYLNSPSKALLAALIAVVLAIGGAAGGACSRFTDSWQPFGANQTYTYTSTSETSASILSQVSPYTSGTYVEVNNNTPQFAGCGITSTDAACQWLAGAISDPAKYSTDWEVYSQLDELGRCGMACACVGKETMPADGEERTSISEIHPTGWQRSKYDFIENELLYNRSHLLGWSLTAENANECNLVTGTRYFNADGMQPFEEGILQYVRKTGNHVLYCVTPVFVGSDEVCRGVLMEALSVEDGGAGVSFCVFCYNVEPGVGIDYATGDNWLDDGGTDTWNDGLDESDTSASA